MSAENSESMFDLGAMRRFVKAKWYWFLISVVACCGLAFAYIKIHKPVYLYNANILIAKEQGDMSAMIPDMGMISGMLGIKNSVEDEILILSSQSLMSSVVKELGLNRVHVQRKGLFGLIKDFKFDDYAIDVMPADPAMLDTLESSVKFNISVDPKGLADIEAIYNKRTVADVQGKSLPAAVTTPLGDFIVSSTSYLPKGKALEYRVTVTGYSSRAQEILEDLKIETVTKKASIVNLSMRHSNDKYAKTLLNTLMQRYNERGIADKRIKDSRNLEFMNSRLEIMAAELAGTESQMEDYMNREGIVNLEADVKFQLELKGMLEESLVKAETQAQVLKMLRDFMRDPSKRYSMLPVTEGVDPLAIQTYNELILKRMQLEQNAKGDNKALAAVTQQIDAMHTSVLEAVDKAYEAAAIALNEVKSRKNGADGRLDRMPEQQRQLLTMMRDQLIKEKIFAFLVQQREQTAMQVANAVPKGTIIDAPYAGVKPVGIKSKILLVIAFIFGLVLPLFVWYLRYILRGRFTTRKELQNRSELVVIGEASHSDERHVPAVSEAVDSSEESEKFRSLRSNVVHHLGEDGKVVLVTSVDPGEGVTFVALNLASSLAMTGKRTLLIDMNLRDPQLDSLLGLGGVAGLTDAYKDSLSATSYSVKSEKCLDLLPAGSKARHPSEILASSRLDEMITALKERYDYIVIDSAPVGKYSDTMSLGRLADITLFVMRAEYSPISNIDKISVLESENRFPALFIVANDTPVD